MVDSTVQPGLIIIRLMDLWSMSSSAQSLRKLGSGRCSSQATFNDQRYLLGGRCLEGQAMSSCIVAIWLFLTSQLLTQEELGNFRYFHCVFLPYRRILFLIIKDVDCFFIS